MSNKYQDFINKISVKTKLKSIVWHIADADEFDRKCGYFRNHKTIFKIFFADIDSSGADEIVMAEKKVPVFEDDNVIGHEQEFEIAVIGGRKIIGNIDRSYVTYRSLLNLYSLVEQENNEAKSFFDKFE